MSEKQVKYTQEQIDSVKRFLSEKELTRSQIAEKTGISLASVNYYAKNTVVVKAVREERDFSLDEVLASRVDKIEQLLGIKRSQLNLIQKEIQELKREQLKVIKTRAFLKGELLPEERADEASEFNS